MSTSSQSADQLAEQDRAEMAKRLGPDWQAGRHQSRDPQAEITTPPLEEMAAAPGATQTKYRVTYNRVGRHGGRGGRPAPVPLTVWAVTAEGLAEHILKDVRPYLASRDVDVAVDLEAMRGFIYAGMNNGGSFTLEAVQVADGGAA